ncbi:hypothetical protein AVEN_140375-1 [Araneus ventricosus]|uniref:Uncharacterized protein n=1 Tax=Araneus ventricosus TaxID=182803 RepID=A0A4Y2P0Z8_ARAVE|nr:hypothetical protein AVEN_140375-1 [Araneus ventricosus]
MIHWGPQCNTRLMGRHAGPTRGGILPSMRSRKQTERRQLLIESSLAYPRGKEGKSKNIRRGKLERRAETRVPRGREARHTWRRYAPEWKSSIEIYFASMFTTIIHCCGHYISNPPYGLSQKNSRTTFLPKWQRRVRLSKKKCPFLNSTFSFLLGV